MARTDGEITVEEPNAEEAVLIDVHLVAAMRKRLALEENAVATHSDEVFRGSRKRVPQSLIDISPKAIAPEMVSIGPFYRGDKELPEFDSLKFWYLKRFLSHSTAPGDPDRLSDLFAALQKLEEKARAFYDEEVLMSSREFIETMLLDGCFILELFRGCVSGHDDPIMTKPWLIPIITRDLLKLENQLPFFVLEELFKVTANNADVGDPVDLLALHFFDLSFPRPYDVLKRKTEADYGHLLDEANYRHLLDEANYRHLLDVFHSSFCSTVEMNHEYQPSPLRLFRPLPQFLTFPQFPEQSEDDRVSLLSVSILRGSPSLTLPSFEEYRNLVMSIPSSTQLRPSGIKFKPHEANSFLQINFRNRVLQIPPIPINDLTITVFICLAYEHWCRGQGKFTHYIAFLSCLINSPKDVAFLCAEGIIASYSHNDHYIAGLFSKLGEKVYFHRNTRGYLDWEFRAVEAYYNSHWGTFMRTYFSTPWAFISVVSAVILLVLTAGQTVLAVLSYTDQRGKQL